VLAGGRSSRMGRDKALLPYRGGALVESVARAVAQAAGSVALVGGAASYEGLGFPLVADLYPGEGPLGGILSALASGFAAWNLIVACDMPELSAKLLEELLDAAERSDAEALLPCGPSGMLEPLCAAYHRSSYGALDAAFARGIRKVTAAFGGLRVIEWPVPERLSLQNVNTPEDWAAYARK
jgi:molybdopterin-guanine dinucleotide biosynthesis protein A